MDIKEHWHQLSPTKRNAYYWAGIILLVDLVFTLSNTWTFLRTGQCRDVLHSASTAACTAPQFLKANLAWISVTNLFMFLPYAAIMTFAAKVLDNVFAKKE